MKEKAYHKFSFDFHKKNWHKGRPNFCQFELTFRCGLRCQHCYTDCYNTRACIDKELATPDIISIIDKVHAARIQWLCFTGGDPVARDDFLDIYTYAKKKGFILIIFTSGYSITKEIVAQMKTRPPLVIEITLNSVTEGSFETIARTKGSFAKVMNGIDLILKAKLPLRLKVQLNQLNLKEVPKIKDFIERLGLPFRPDPVLNARLNHDTAPCKLRITPRDFLKITREFKMGPDFDGMSCAANTGAAESKLFYCAAAGGDGIYLDPYGTMVPCIFVRNPKINLCETTLEAAQREIVAWVRAKDFSRDTKCKACSLRPICLACPGRALLETKDIEAPIPYFCTIAHRCAESIKDESKN